MTTWPHRQRSDLTQASLSDLLEFLGRHRVNSTGRAVSLNTQEMYERERRLRRALKLNPDSAILNRFLSQTSSSPSQRQ